MLLYFFRFTVSLQSKHYMLTRTHIIKVMKSRAVFLLLSTLTALAGWAQETGLTTGATVCHDGDSIFITITLNNDSIGVGDTDILTVRPSLRGREEGQKQLLPAWHIMGRHPYYRHLRGEHLSAVECGDRVTWEKSIRKEREKKMQIPANRYFCSAPYEAWMDSTSLEVIFERTDRCGTLRYSQTDTYPVGVKERIETLSAPRHITFSEGGTANIAFLVNDTRLLPNHRNNRRELSKITADINKVLSDTTATIKKLYIHGYASPDGGYDNNVRLAHERTDSLKAYIVRTTPLTASQIEAASTPEDWEGLRKYVEAASTDMLPHRQELLDIIDSDGNPDEKERSIKQLYPADYQHLLVNCLPHLRRTDYKVDYTLQHELERDTTITYAWHIPVGVRVQMQPAKEPKTFRPFMAVKTNMLYDAIVAPNIELEFALGRNSKYSLMAEFAMPWFVWHRNSRAYEIMEGGLELRRWFGKCRDCYRAPLTGFFIGLYGAGGKYDIEWDTDNRHEDYNGVGDQGEFISAGLSFGYCWPIARRLNLELSAAAGAIWGPRRHYHGEFDDTHLIWKYNSTIFWAGPTKAKLSLVWLIGNKKKKGGCK